MLNNKSLAVQLCYDPARVQRGDLIERVGTKLGTLLLPNHGSAPEVQIRLVAKNWWQPAA
jgi:hypothetical protein